MCVTSAGIALRRTSVEDIHTFVFRVGEYAVKTVLKEGLSLLGFSALIVKDFKDWRVAIAFNLHIKDDSD